ncbi:pre-rrna-processing pno1 [Apiospora phragmitis]|uniref:Pre-rRNA-processing protein PNO1 n=1 Tax=Apiospora phragmitis TaxID=2905665 RepID=A0ABR1TUV4_9PEZI
MPAPTALLQKPVEATAEAPLPQPDQDDEVLPDAAEMNTLDTSTIQLVPVDHNEAQMDVDEEGKPRFAPAREIGTVARIETRKTPIPPHRMSPLKATWPKIYPVLVEHLNLAVRMNVKSKAVELRTTRKTTDTGALQKGADFITAFALGFDVDDAIALLRLDDLYIETFEIKDVKTLEGDHKARAIGRIAGKDGKTKYAIENASKTRIVLADAKVHILGGFKNIHIAREAIVSLILGKQPGKVYNGLRTVASRMKERF